ncbi:MAG TPA: GntR family transcriptional regulator [Acetobacteraceae bacterium]|jgi:DNA-binding GntR family transcriptional regulator|nr:GntR family transcriptional regulator [Acetobacteraceae bacterium]
MLVTAPLSEQILSAIIRRIVEGVYVPGDRLVELKLAAEFGVSQAPVREAFRQLTAMNFLCTSNRRGTYVSDMLGAGLADLFVARGGLEETATRLATPLRAGAVDDLWGHVQSMREAAAAQDIAHLERASVAFHRTIVEASGNRLILRLWSSLLIEAHTDLTLRLLLPTDLAFVAESHAPIVAAMAAIDAEGAARLARLHQDEFIRMIGGRWPAPKTLPAGLQ